MLGLMTILEWGLWVLLLKMVILSGECILLGWAGR